MRQHPSFSKYILFLLCSLSLVALLGGAALADSNVFGQRINGWDVELPLDIPLSQNVFWQDQVYRTEHYLTYDPDSRVIPLVVYGSKVTNYGNFPSMAALAEAKGYTVLAAINGDFYDTKNYQPLGIVVTEGILRCSDGGKWAIGFDDRGNAVIGKPEMEMALTVGETEYYVHAVNRMRQSYGFTLYTEDFSHTNRTTEMGTNVICTVVDDAPLTLDCDLTLAVEEVIYTQLPLELEEGKVMLSIPDSGYPTYIAAAQALRPGDTVGFRVRSADGWDDIEEALGSPYPLLVAGEVQAGSPAEAAPRTAVGIKADGSVVLYTMDGRQSGYSAGAGGEQIARRMQELGCVDALLLDGGGSTSLNGIWLGDESASQINRPSGGSQRSVTNYLMLVTDRTATGKASQLAVYPSSTHMLVGASRSFTVKAADRSGFAAPVPGNLSLSAGSLGYVEDGVFFATAAGSGSVTAVAPGVAAGSAAVNVVATPDSITLWNAEGKQVSALLLEIRDEVELDASARWHHLNLIADDACFIWESSDPELFTVTSHGTVTALANMGEGMLTVSAGEKQVEIPVSVTLPPGRYADVYPEDWYYDTVFALGQQELMKGTSATEFSPAANMNRAMLVTVLWRMAGSPVMLTEEGEPMTSAFTDVQAGQWYTEAVIWGAESGIVTGYSDGRFGVTDPVTREQIAALLFRYAQAEAAAFDLSAYADMGQISPYAAESLQWAVANGLISGRNATTLAPRASATRAEVATILARYLAM